MASHIQTQDTYGQDYKLIKVSVTNRGRLVFTYRSSFPSPETFPRHIPQTNPYNDLQHPRHNIQSAHWILKYWGRDVMARGPIYEPRIALGAAPWMGLDGSRLFVRDESAEDAEKDEGFGLGVRVRDQRLREEVEKAVERWIEEVFEDEV